MCPGEAQTWELQEPPLSAAGEQELGGVSDS